MKNHKVYAIGETVLDIIFENNEPKAAKPGGSTLNSSVSLGRLGVPVSFVSEWGKDKVGDLIENFLKSNRVLTDYVYRYTDAKTILAIAFLDENKNAGYEFYKNFPEKRMQIKFPEFSENDIVLFSSFFAINQQVRPLLLDFLKKAKKAGAILIYDPNFRKSHSDELEKLKHLILENISMADLVRGSDEDFENIFGSCSPHEAYSELSKAGCKNLVYTASDKGVHVLTENIEKFYKVPEIKPVSTIGAGDNFNAGIIFGILKNRVLKQDINQITIKQWDSIIKTSISLAQEVCMSWENYVPEGFAIE